VEVADTDTSHSGYSNHHQSLPGNARLSGLSWRPQEAKLGSTTALTGSGGNVIERKQYESFGESQNSSLLATITPAGQTGRLSGASPSKIAGVLSERLGSFSAVFSEWF
jgi:hypothetical protein